MLPKLSRFLGRREGTACGNRFELPGLAVIFALICSAYAYIGLPPAYPVRLERESADYYNLLASGLLAGKTSLSLEPPASLVALADPYDPVQRAQSGGLEMHDATYYKGKYYLYFGVVPALVLFAPFKAVTGFYFPQHLATVLFCAGGLFWSLGLLRALRRDAFPGVATRWVWLAAVMLGLGNFCLVMVVRNSVWEVPISSAYCWSMLGLWCVVRHLTVPAGRGAVAWLAFAGAAFGLAIGSRPHFIFGAAVLVGLWAWRWLGRWRRNEWDARVFTREAVAALVPLGLIIAGLLAYNYARFDSPFEFGQRYQLAGNRQVDSQLLSFRFLPANFYYYFIAPAQLERYFPFTQVIHGLPWARPADYGGSENPYGLLPNAPFSWLALAAPLVWFSWQRRDPRIGRWLVLFGALFGTMVVVVMCFAWSATRYMVDFLPSLLLVATVGLFGLVEADPTAPLRRLLRWPVVAAVAITAGFVTLVTLRHDVYRAHRASDFAALSRIFNQPVYWWEKFHPQAYGPLAMTVRFPADRLGKAEPLAVNGVSFLTDYLYVYYFPDGRNIQLRFNHTNYNELSSQPIPIDFDLPHRVEIAAGFLYPMASHPFFSGWTPAKVGEAKKTLEVRIDGVPYLMARQDVFDSSPEHLTFGENRVSEYIGAKFSGKMTDLVRHPLPDPVLAFEGGGFVRLAMVLPAGAGGRSETLVTTGAPGRQDALAITYEPGNQIHFELRHDGGALRTSQPIEVSPGGTAVFEISLGSFYSTPRNSREEELSGLAVVRANGRMVWREKADFHPAGGAAPLFPVATAAGVGGFSGRVLARLPVQIYAGLNDSRFAVAPYWVETDAPGFGALRLHLSLPLTPARASEPLVVSGASTPTADYVFANYLPGGRFTLGFLHAGAEVVQSSGFRTEGDRVHTLEVSLPSFFPSEQSSFFAARTLEEIAAYKRERVQVKLDGRAALGNSVQTYAVNPEAVTVGVDHLGQSFGTRFSGKIIAVERSNLLPPAGLVENDGPLELTVILPEQPATAGETLLATGVAGKMDALVLMPAGAKRARLEVRLADGTGTRSEIIPLDAAPHVLTVDWGGLNVAKTASAAGPANPSARAWKIRLDGKVVLEGTGWFVAASPQAVVIGGDEFTGRLKSVRRLP